MLTQSLALRLALPLGAFFCALVHFLLERLNRPALVFPHCQSRLVGRLLKKESTMQDFTLKLDPYAGAHIIVRRVTAGAWETNEESEVVAYVALRNAETSQGDFEHAVIAATRALRAAYQFDGQYIHIETRFSDTYVNG